MTTPENADRRMADALSLWGPSFATSACSSADSDGFYSVEIAGAAAAAGLAAYEASNHRGLDGTDDGSEVSHCELSGCPAVSRKADACGVIFNRTRPFFAGLRGSTEALAHEEPRQQQARAERGRGRDACLLACQGRVRPKIYLCTGLRCRVALKGIASTADNRAWTWGRGGQVRALCGDDEARRRRTLRPARS